ncbi:hypothetical protein EV215_1700 [Hypnocyclicus thermotrophus]|uniref:Outer membrane protein beta-barrel domain-containing protein n=1 Tax=Hypnocyclicus thermotrophus TaxID=1627895 RepID=A0AA46I556_9FUSO|nr:hypothetical protein [Hypnocyclicus thermotrophus]TDT68633.1 hypothetical protein EV215_1700 [Hypnocyclicus thermotrophus]
MKKTLILFILLMGVQAYALDITLRLPVSTNTAFQKLNETDNSARVGIGLEAGQDLITFSIGAGMEWDKSISLSTGEKFAPRLTYGYLKYNLFPVAFKPYLVGKYGYMSAYSKSGFTSLDTSTFWGMGLGIDIFNSQGELLYTNYPVTINGTKDTMTMITLALGIKIF